MDALRRRCAARGDAGIRVRARELDQRCRAGGVVVRARSNPGVVAVSHDDDYALRVAGREREQVDESHPPPPRDLRGERLRAHGEAVGSELRPEPVARAGRPRRTRDAVRVVEREIPGQVDGGGAVEGGRQCGGRERRRPGDAERGHEEGERDEEPGPPVEPPVHGPLEGAGPGPAPLRCRRNGRHPGL